MSSRRNSLAIAGGAVLAAALLAGWVLVEQRSDQLQLKREVKALTGGDVDRGERAFLRHGCGGCHSIDGVPQAAGLVGPPLTGIGRRAIIGGRLGNNPTNLRRWIEDPQLVSPGTAMPDLNVSPADSRDIAAFLYTRD
jgi:cytochrome c